MFFREMFEVALIMIAKCHMNNPEGQLNNQELQQQSFNFTQMILEFRVSVIASCRRIEAILRDLHAQMLFGRHVKEHVQQEIEQLQILECALIQSS